MQKVVIKKVKILFLALALVSQVAYAQLFDYELNVADSLFAQNKFTESFEIYRVLLEEGRVTSPAMLLKMAYIKEGLKEIDFALYYLTLYHQATADSGATEKMESLASKHRLQGYDITTTRRIINEISPWLKSLKMAAMSLLGLLLVITVWTYRKNLRPAPFPAIMCLVLGVLLFVFTNYDFLPETGITTGKQVYFMQEASSAAPVIEITGAGHRLEVLGRKDVWYRVKWRGKTAYIRDIDLAMVKLR
jgi:hypothetical protein